MGGSAFHDLEVPRMSHEEYESMRDRCICILSRFYEKIVAAPEAPEKLDHGDVDLLVEGPKSSFTTADLAAALQATKYIHGQPVTTPFAIPLPGKSPQHAQVDVHVCLPGQLEWEQWMGGYGDLCQILGVLNRSIGLTMNDKGLNVRVEELESTNRKASMILLTNEVPRVMAFLGLDSEMYRNQGFQTLEEIFAWCARGRFYGVPRQKEDCLDGYGLTVAEENSNDRQRFRKRQMFSKFVKEWAPTHPEAFTNQERWPRDQVLQEAISFFGVQGKYDAIITVWKQEVREKHVVDQIQAVIPEQGPRLKEVMRGLKRWTSINQGQPELNSVDDEREIGAIPEWMSRLTDAQLPALLTFVRENHVELRAREKARAKARKQMAIKPI